MVGHESNTPVLKFMIDIMGYVPGIGEHSLTVSILSYFISSEFFEDESRALYGGIAGALHDVGYLVPKVSQMSRKIDVVYDENMIKMLSDLHTTIGGFILSNFLGLYEYSDVAFYHHLPADQLDIMNPSHIFANIVSVADLLSVQFEKLGSEIPKQFIKETLKEHEEQFFPEVFEAALKVVERDYTWWSIEDPTDFYLRNLSTRIEKSEIVDESILMELGYFMAYIVDSKSPFTRKHSERIADISKEIGREMNLSDRDQMYLYIAGLFHDAGKLAIEDRILEKPGVLTKKEYSYMRKHVFYTMKFLEHFTREGNDWTKWASQHHERIDGSGYPLRLKGNEISLQSRILQVADVFVALTEDRPYRSPMSFEDTLEFLSKEVQKGKMDGEVLKALERLVKNGYTFPSKTPISEMIETVDFLIKSYGGIA